MEGHATVLCFHLINQYFKAPAELLQSKWGTSIRNTMVGLVQTNKPMKYKSYPVYNRYVPLLCLQAVLKYVVTVSPKKL